MGRLGSSRVRYENAGKAPGSTPAGVKEQAVSSDQLELAGPADRFAAVIRR